MTHLEQWLRENHRSPAWLARELGISKDPIYLLATPMAQARPFHSVRFEIFQQVSAFTGIPAGVLLEDVMGGGIDGDAAIRG